MYTLLIIAAFQQLRQLPLRKCLLVNYVWTESFETLCTVTMPVRGTKVGTPCNNALHWQ